MKYEMVTASKSKRNKKIFYKYINIKMKTKVQIDPLQDDKDELVINDKTRQRCLTSSSLLVSPKKR